MSSSSKAVKSPETVAIRFPKGLWHQVRQVALASHETGMGWLVRAAETALGSVAGKNDEGAAVRTAGEASSKGASKGVRTKDPLHGTPEAIGTSEAFPVTTRPEYLGIAREPASPEYEPSPAKLYEPDVPVTAVMPGSIAARHCGWTPEMICKRCGQAWRNHQDGSKKNRATLTGCTIFEPTEPVF